MTQHEAEAPPAAVTVDARGLSCPLPVLRLNTRLRGLSPGATLVLLATDRAALRDVLAYCAAHGHAVDAGEEAGLLRFLIRKAGP